MNNRPDPTDYDARGRREPTTDKRSITFRAMIPAKMGAIAKHGNGTMGRVTIEVERDAFEALDVLAEDYSDGEMFEVVITPLGWLEEGQER